MKRSTALKAQPSKPAASVEAPWRSALEGAGDGVWDWDLASGSVQFSEHWKTMLGHEAHEIGSGYEEWEKRVHPEDLPGVLEQIQAHLKQHSPVYSVEFRMRCKDGSWKWILARGMITSHDAKGRPQRIIGTHTDISAWRMAQQRESEILRLIVQGTPLPDVLTAIVLRVEGTHPGLICCLKLLNETRDCLHVAAGPSLPSSYRKIINRMPVSAQAACSGSAAYSGQRVISRRIASDPAWKPYHAAARRAKLAACWAEPVRNGMGTLLGAFACYYRQPHTPHCVRNPCCGVRHSTRCRGH